MYLSYQNAMRATLILPSFLLTSTAERFPPPTGLYQVGTTQHVFNHTTPNDPVAPANASSILLATIYYPTFSIPRLNTTASYLDFTTANLWSTALQFPPNALSRFVPWTQHNAPYLPSTRSPSLPTVILSPGGGVNGIMYTALTTHLASAGYTVVALDHPGEIPYLHLPNGTGIYGIDITAVWPRETQTAVYHMRVSDTRAVLTTLFPAYATARGAPWNLTHYVVVGHSVGGAAAAGVAAVEPSVLAGVNLDGGFFDLPDVLKPFLMVAGEEHTLALDPSWPSFAEVQTAEWTWVNVTGSSHLDFSDLGSWVDLLGVRRETITPELGGIWAPRMMAVVSGMVMRFLEGILGGERGGEGG